MQNGSMNHMNEIYLDHKTPVIDDVYNLWLMTRAGGAYLLYQGKYVQFRIRNHTLATYW